MGDSCPTDPVVLRLEYSSTVRERDEALARVEHVTSDRDRLVVQVAALQRTNYSANAD